MEKVKQDKLLKEQKKKSAQIMQELKDRESMEKDYNMNYGSKQLKNGNFKGFLTLTNKGTKIGRNDQCYCDSGKKFKYCCGDKNE